MDGAGRSGAERGALSAIALLLGRDGAPADPALFGPLLAALDHRGAHGRRILARHAALLGHQHFWTTPEEVGERQPLSDPAAGVDVSFDGRLDNRDELLAALGLPASEALLSDAALVLRAYDRWGERCFERFVGPFAVVLLDGRRSLVLCARDALGERGLFYVLTGRALAVASEESALLALPWVSRRLDEATVARFFAVEPPAPDATFFAEIRELPRASVLAVGGERVRTWRHWEPDFEPLRLRRDGDYAEAFGERLTESVRCRLRAATPCAVLMSGGLDSTAVAAVAARQGGAGRLRAVSWVFDELAACDERRFMDPVVERYGLDSVRIAGDDGWPLSGPGPWPHNPNTPVEGVYRRLRQRAYAAARDSGAAVILSGEYADDLYAGGEDWLADLLGERRLVTAAAGLLAHAGLCGVRRAPVRHGLGSAVRRILERRRPGAAPRPVPAWLTREAAARLVGGEPSVPLSPRAVRRPRQGWALLAGFVPRAAPVELHHAGRAGVELRRPFRDRRLVELALRLPAHQLYRPGWSKWILRRALRGILPEPVRLRRRTTSLLPLCARGLAERELPAVRRLLAGPDAAWRRYVLAEWLDEVFPARFLGRTDGVELVVPWQCICFELWRKGLAESPFARIGVSSWEEIPA